MAVKLSGSPGEYLIWFRPERVRTVTWGGDPNKAVLVGDTPQDLSPRRSFAQWHEVVEGTGDPWSDADLVAARLIGDTVKDVILQFRSVAYADRAGAARPGAPAGADARNCRWWWRRRMGGSCC